MISGIMPVYNCADFIQESVQSVLDQTEKDFELLVMDDCSTDGTVGQLKIFDDPRIKIFTSDRNIGQANQLNKGIGQAKGDYIAILHGDDINHPERFSAQLEAFGKDPGIGILGTWIEYIGSRQGEWKTPVDPQDCFMELLMESPLAHPTVMIHRERLRGVEVVYRQDRVPAEDYDLWVRLSASCKMSNIPRKLLKYRVHDKQISMQKADLLKEKIAAIRKDLIALYLDDAGQTPLEALRQLWDFHPGCRMSYAMIRNCSALSGYLSEKHGIGRGKTKSFFDQWLYGLFLITGNYDTGVGFYFLFSRPFYFFRKKGADLARILFRSLYGKTRLFLS
jgi:glycosyltransferase involved in cell wall biosynthesis